VRERWRRRAPGQRLEPAEGSGEADVVAVVTGFDDPPVTDPDDEHARHGEIAAVGRPGVGELRDDHLGVSRPVHDHVRRRERPNAGCSLGRPGEMLAQLGASTQWLITQRRKRVPDVRPFPVQTRERVELVLPLVRREIVGYQPAYASGDHANDVGRVRLSVAPGLQTKS